MGEQPQIDDGWDRGWEEHQTRQRMRMANLPFHLKLRWLEEAHALVLSIARLNPDRFPSLTKIPEDTIRPHDPSGA